MSQSVVKATSNRPLGSGSSRRLRREGNLPGVVYGLGSEPVPIAVNYIELRDVMKGVAGLNTVFDLDIDGKNETVYVRDLQRDVIRREVTHVDFMRVDDKVPVKVKVPVKLVGDDSNLTNAGGTVEQKIFTIEIKALPTSIPLALEADVSLMTLDRRLSVGDLNLPEGVTALVDDNISVAAPVIHRAVDLGEPAEAAAGEEGGTEGEEGEAAEGGASEEKSE